MSATPEPAHVAEHAKAVHPAFSLDGVTVTFPDGTTGLRDITLNAHPGEFLALIGPSGSGKTTLLRTLAGFITPTAGRLTIDNEDMTDTPPEKRRLGMVFQQHAVWPHMSVARNVAYPLERARISAKERKDRVSTALDLVGLTGFGDRSPASLSGGQRQRVALARAIVARPRLLLLDEALSALDEPLRDSLRREILGLSKREHLTTVHVTHDRAEALALADRVVLLSRGEIQQIATPAELLSAPATPDVARFIADATVLPATLEGDHLRCDSLGIAFPLSEVRRVPTSGEPNIAILPTSVRVVSPANAGVRGEITSLLFERSGFSATIDAAGHTFRALLEHPQAKIGDTVGLKIERPIGYF